MATDLADGFSGGCFCGAVLYRVTAAPRFAYVCHCTDCRRINGSAFHIGLAVDREAFVLERGAPSAFVATADSGHTITRYACPVCASQLWSHTSADASMVSVKAGSVTSAPAQAIRPTLEIFADSRVPWAQVPHDCVIYARSPRNAPPIRGEAPAALFRPREGT